MSMPQFLIIFLTIRVSSDFNTYIPDSKFDKSKSTFDSKPDFKTLPSIESMLNECALLVSIFTCYANGFGETRTEL